VDLLVKGHFDSAERAEGKFSTALASLPLGHGVETKPPSGKFEYLEKGRCADNGRERTVKRFVMVCSGSGITAIYQFFRTGMQDT